MKKSAFAAACLVLLAYPTHVIGQDTPQRKFDKDAIERLLKERASQDHKAPNLPEGHELGVFQSYIMARWLPPAEAKPNTRVTLRIKLGRDGRLSTLPAIVAGSDDSKALRESAIAVVTKSQPYTMFKPENYERWRDIEMIFIIPEVKR